MPNVDVVKSNYSGSKAQCRVRRGFSPRPVTGLCGNDGTISTPVKDTWAHSGTGGRFAVNFRKGSIVVRISSDSLQLARRFAPEHSHSECVACFEKDQATKRG